MCMQAGGVMDGGGEECGKRGVWMKGKTQGRTQTSGK